MLKDFLFYALFGVFGLLFGFLSFQVFQLKKRLDIFLSKNNQGLEKTFKDLIVKSEKGEKNIQAMLQRVSILEDTAKISFQKIGVIRYNPLKEMGGDQSFSIALLDKNDSGFIISALYMREKTRIFAKPIIQGKSKYSLSQEEEKAVEKAKGL